MNYKSRYFLGAAVAVPLLPILFVQGKQIRKRVPKLPEARQPEGSAGVGKQHIFRVLFIGESTVAGVGVDTHENGFAGSFARALAEQYDCQVDWKVYARSGYTLERSRRKLLPQLNHEQADLLIVGTGGNDAFTLNRPGRFQQQAHQFINDLRSLFPDAPIVFTNMPPIKSFPAFTASIRFVLGNLVEILGESLSEVVTVHPNVFYNSELVDTATWKARWQVEGELADFFSDGVHPAPITYQVWGKDMVRFIKAHDILNVLGQTHQKYDNQ
ncbi:MAG: SGNH/GDSL hydrolase family protein [Bacteroidota bacterium]